MRGPSESRTLCGVVSEWPAHQRRCGTTRTESALRSSSTRYAPSAVARSRSSSQAACATSATSTFSPRGTAGHATSCARKSSAMSPGASAGRPRGSATGSARGLRGSGASSADEVVFFSSRLARVWHAAGQRLALLPETPEEGAACAAIAALAVALLVGSSAVLSALHLGGVF